MNPKAITIGEETTTDYYKARDKEWIITNGIGGYASSTVIGANTRGYHGLLIACIPPALNRMLLLSKLEEEVIINDKTHHLSVNKYPDIIHPNGNMNLKEFRFEHTPTFCYKFSNTTIEKVIDMPKGRNSSIISYKVATETPIEMSIRPLINYRSLHKRTQAGSRPAFTQQSTSEGTQIEFDSRQFLYLKCSVGNYDLAETWYRDMVYDIETVRYLEDREDHFSPGTFTATLKDGDSLSIEASNDSKPSHTSQVNNRIRYTPSEIDARTNLLLWLTRTADQFITTLPNGEMTIIAGYHWFGEWGRDAAISLPGLLLTTRRFSEAKEVIRRFLLGTRNGLVPVYYDEYGTPNYASIDTSLWLVYAIQKYLTYSNDLEFAGEVTPKIIEIIESYRHGTNYGVHEAEDGLIETNIEEGSLTWMDARVDGKPVTPRGGKCVEVNALWYNAVRFASELNQKITGDPTSYNVLSKTIKRSFNEAFWNDKNLYLYDFIKDGVGDTSIRPNQIISISLPYPVLAKEKWGMVFKNVERHLLTPYGLRTLTPTDPRYCKRCFGSPRNRDTAYHNGTVWAWLIGPFITAYKKLGWDPKGPLIQHITESFTRHLKEAGLGSISEIFDGDSPHLPGGCISQAWSVGELMRAYSEDLHSGKGMNNEQPNKI